MRKILLTSAAISALALSGPAIAASPDAAAKAPSDPTLAGLEAPAVAADDWFRLVEMDDPLEEEEDDDLPEAG